MAVNTKWSGKRPGGGTSRRTQWRYFNAGVIGEKKDGALNTLEIVRERDGGGLTTRYKYSPVVKSATSAITERINNRGSVYKIELKLINYHVLDSAPK